MRKRLLIVARVRGESLAEADDSELFKYSSRRLLALSRLILFSSLIIMTLRPGRLISEAATLEELLPIKSFYYNLQANNQNNDMLQIELANEDADQNADVRSNDQLSIESPVPVIGVLTEVLRDYKRFVDDRRLFIASSYIKWIESSGAQVVPVLLNQDDSYYEQIFQQTNGLLFPGGDNLLDPSKRTPMMVAAKKLYKLAVAANDRGDYYPIWGTCLGLELLSVLTASKNVLVDCEANDISLAMEFTNERGKLFSRNSYSNLPGLSTDFSQIIVDTLRHGNLTYNFHHKCLTDAGLKAAGLVEFYKPLAYSRDKNNLRFIAIMEATKYPFFAVQFHPEKPLFEFVVKKSQLNVPHSRQSIAVSRFFADFFVQQAQLNGHHAIGSNEEERERNGRFEQDLIYAFDPMFTAPKRDMYEQRYLFPYDSSRALANGLSNEEFIDHVPDSDGEVTEEVSRAGKTGTQEGSNSDIEDADVQEEEQQKQQPLSHKAGNSLIAINQLVAIDYNNDADGDDLADYDYDETVDQDYATQTESYI